MEVIIPKKTDKKEPKFIQKLDPHKSYLIEQKQFGGKDLDFLIIHMSENPEVFGFQVSTYKTDIFTSLQKTYESLIHTLKISFDINLNENTVYFGYIFDYSRLNDPLYIWMLRTCKLNNMKYSFFNTDNNTLYLDKGIKTNNIYDIVGKPINNINTNIKYQI